MKRRGVTARKQRGRHARRSPGVRVTPRLLLELCDGNEVIAGRIMERAAGHQIPQLTDSERERWERNARVRAIVDREGYDAAVEQTGLSLSQVERIAGGAPEGARRAYVRSLARRAAQLKSELGATEKAIEQAGGMPPQAPRRLSA